MNKVKVLIIDDSAVVRKMLTEALSISKRIEVVGAALDPFIAVNKIKKLKPDVLTLDIEMPRMDGITFLSKLMISNPMPVIMVSAQTEEGADITMKALETGAVDFILKPQFSDEKALDRFAEELIEKVIGASQSKIKRKTIITAPLSTGIEIQEKYSADIILQKKPPEKIKARSNAVIAIGASTGGTEAIASIISKLSADVPGVLVTQHMPEKFTKSFAERVDRISALKAKEAENGDRVYRGTCFIAPGGKHMLLRSDKDGYYVEINDGPPVNRHKPAVDVLFRSVAQVASKNSVGIILTGMGRDGAEGLLEIYEAGIATIAQDEASCVIFGMPAEAIKLGAATIVSGLAGITEYINSMAAAHTY